MPTLLIELSGPQQAWGSHSRFASRDTERAPTRSGVIGLVAAALGVRRDGDLQRFEKLEFGVRIDQPGRVASDFQTARTLDGRTSLPLSHRSYLADAVFLVGLGSTNVAELNEMREALAHPVFPLYLGRRAFPPAGPLPTEVVEAQLRDALLAADWRATPSYRERVGDEKPVLEIRTDARPGEPVDHTVRDVPRSFDPRRRRYDWRDVRVQRASFGAGRSAGPDWLALVSEEEV